MKQINKAERTVVFFSLIADEIDMGGKVNWRSPEDILTQAIVRIISGPEARVEASLIPFTDRIKEEIKRNYEGDTLRALVSYAAGEELLTELETNNYYTELAKQLLSRFCRE